MTGYSFEIVPSKQSLLSRLETANHFAKLQNRKKSMHRNGVSRWFSTGIRGIPLPSILIGGKKYSSLEAIDWWIRVTTAAASPAASTYSAPAIAAPLTAQEQRTLEEAGIATEVA